MYRLSSGMQEQALADGYFKLKRSSNDKSVVVFNLKRDMVVIGYTHYTNTILSHSLIHFRDTLLSSASNQTPMAGKRDLPREPVLLNPLSELRCIAVEARSLCSSADEPISTQYLENIDILKQFTKLELIFIFESIHPLTSEREEFRKFPESEWEDYHRRVVRELRTRWQEGRGKENKVPKVEWVQRPQLPGTCRQQ